MISTQAQPEDHESSLGVAVPDFKIKTFAGEKTFEVHPGSSIVFLGANGSGKTRLGVAIEAQLGKRPSQAHRIAAQRSISMNAKVIPPSLDEAEKTLFHGSKDAQDDYGHTQLLRWKQKPATQPLNDFVALLGALYAEETNASITYRRASLASKKRLAPTQTKLDRLKQLWEDVLPHRELVVLHNDVQVRPTGDVNNYNASDMSDGERLIFYMIGQCLMVKSKSVIIIDEPELHLNRSIIGALWDSIESERRDCSFIYITHDIEFVNSRQAAEKYFVASIDFKSGPTWDIRPIPASSGIPDDVMGVIVGSRRPILFVEGEASSLDISVYRRIYSGFTVIPLGSCDSVIHAVTSFRVNSDLHHLRSYGIVDLDGRTTAQVKALDKKGIKVLPVAEVENLLLLPKIFTEVAKLFHFSGNELDERVEDMQRVICEQAAVSAKAAALRFMKRQVDSTVKSVDLTGKSALDVQNRLTDLVNSLDMTKIFEGRKREIDAAVSSRDIAKLLNLIDQKGLLSEAAKILGAENRRKLEEFVGRSLSSEIGGPLRKRLLEVLPQV